MFTTIPILLSALSLASADPAPPDQTVISSDDAAYRCFRQAQRRRAGPDALRICTLAIERSRTAHNRKASHVNRGVIRYNAADYALAIEDFTAAIEDYGSKDARVFVNRGLAYEMVAPGDPKREALARADYEAALRARPDNKVAASRLEALKLPYLERRPLRYRTIT